MYSKVLCTILGWLLVLGSAVAAERQLKIAAVKPPAGGERRLALVVGNAAYKASPLLNPVRDAHLVARALSEAGFTVVLVENATQGGLRSAIREFGDQLVAGGVGLFYYAGHGMQVRGRNYLIPVNADIQREDEVADQGVDADLVLAKMESARNGLNVVILDACRNNPFARSFRSSNQGLAQMDAPSGTLIAFATAPGQVASDGSESTGLYSKHLVAAIRKPGLPVEQLFKQVRIGVTQETGDRQIPWESSSLKGDFYFLPPLASAEQLDRRRVEEMIQAALARDSERARIPAAPPPAAPLVRPAPQPAPVPVALPALLPAGAEWTYRRSGPRGQTAEYAVKLEAATEAELLDLTRRGRQAPVEWAHGKGAYLAGATGSEIPEFSPYIGLFEPLRVGTSWPAISLHQVAPCTNLGYRCSASARVVAQEDVSVSAGRFQAFRIEVELIALAMTTGPNVSTRSGTAKITYWYADAARRVVKARVDGDRAIIDPVETELLAFKGVPDAPAASVQTASAAPTAVVAPPARVGLPRQGSRWTYRLLPTLDTAKRMDYTVELHTATDTELADTTRRLRSQGFEWVHAKGAYLLGIPGTSIVDFSPYVGAFQPLQIGGTWPRMDIQQVYPCSDPVYRCSAQGRVTGRESVTVAAGTFNTFRIEVELIAIASGSGNTPVRSGTGWLSFWFAEDAKRMVKFQARGDRHIVEPVDVELVSYTLN